MKLKNIVWGVLVVSALSAQGLLAETPVVKGELADVSEKDIELYIENLILANKQEALIDSAVVQQIADLVYVTRVLAEESKDIESIDNTKVAWLGQFQMDSVLKEALLNIEAQESLKRVNFDNTAKDLYEKQKGQFLTETEVHAAHLLLNTRGKDEEEVKQAIQGLREKALAGEDFLTLAKEHSEDPSAKRNSGDLGFFGKGKMVKPFEEAAFAMAPGDISEPVKTPFGYHLIKVIDKKGGEPRPFEEVKPAIVSELKKQLASKYKVDRLNSIVKGAKSKLDDKVISRVVLKYNKPQEKKD